MATSSFDKTFVINSDEAADVLIKLAMEDTPREEPRPPSYRLLTEEEVINIFNKAKTR